MAKTTGGAPEGEQTTRQAAADARGSQSNQDSGPRDIPTDVERDAQGTLKYEHPEDATAAALLRERQNAQAAEDGDRVREIEDQIKGLGYRVPTDGESNDRQQTAEQSSRGQRTAQQ